MLTFGLAIRLWYQSGFVGCPPLDAKIAQPPLSSFWYATGFTRSVPVLAPVWWTSRIGMPSNMPPTLPSFARNSSMIFLFQSSLGHGSSFRHCTGVLGLAKRSAPFPSFPLIGSRHHAGGPR